MRKALHLLLFILPAFLQAAQGAFSGATLCREGNGEVVLEWSGDARCEGAGGEALPCANKSGRTNVEHCDACLDIPVPSEESAKSPAVTPELLHATASTPLEAALREPAGARVAPIAIAFHPAVERLASIRLLI